MQHERTWLKCRAHKLKGMRDSGPLPDAKRNKIILVCLEASGPADTLILDFRINSGCSKSFTLWRFAATVLEN